MLDPTNDKGGWEEEFLFERDFPCMIHDDQGYNGEYRCGYGRYDIKSGYRRSTRNVSVAIFQFLRQVEHGSVFTLARIEGFWSELDAVRFIESQPKLYPPKPGYSDTCYVLAPSGYWKPFVHSH